MKIPRSPTLEPAVPDVEIVGTRTAARSLNRQPRTLQAWARQGEGPIVPVKIGGRYGWPVARIRSLLAGR